ncbi:hypothetical protein [Nonomuraea endophytica]|uniref:hypothetical protein n=1 Tax=Nonomuraea endophytica TaxID=714136 RepID=UPI0037C70277
MLPPDSSLHIVAGFLGGSGDYRTAKALTRDIYEHLLSVDGPDHPDTLAIQHNLAHLMKTDETG